MPELPEVETIKRGLSRLIVGKKILDFESSSAKQIQPSVGFIKKAIIGATVKKVARRAKLLQIFLSNNRILVIHLKLTGRLLVRKKGDPVDDWQRAVISLSGGRELRFCDLRKFGWIRLVKNDELQTINQKFGIEPFTRAFTLDNFRQILASTKRPIKIVLMDQKKISGVGNIYANEALFLAKIDPRRPAAKLNGKEVGVLYQALNKVLKAGIKYRGATEQYYLDALGRKGSYQKHYLVYSREGEKCLDCGGVVRKIKLGGRGTYFCPKCQR